MNQLYAVMDFIRSNTKKKWRKAGLTRIESPEYDEEALREAVVNGIIHREYTRLGAEVSVDIYDNRIEITSPGSMFSGKRIDKTIDRVVVSERSIIEFIEADADVTIEAIALRLGKTESTIKKAIKKLKAKEIVVRVGADKTGFWQIKR